MSKNFIQKFYFIHHSHREETIHQIVLKILKAVIVNEAFGKAGSKFTQIIEIVQKFRRFNIQMSNDRFL